MIIVTGATGKLGRAIVEKLLDRTAATELGVSVRDPSKAQELGALGVRVRQADFGDPASLRHAFEGASQVLIVSSNARATGGQPEVQHRNALETARDVGARRVVYTSQISASPESAFRPGVDHAQTEAMLASSGMKFTALRNGFYASHALGVVAQMMKSGESFAPADGKTSWTAHADLAEAAAAILMDEGRFDGPTPPLTGGEALDFSELAAIASELGGRKIEHVTMTDDEYRARLLARGAPPGAVEFAIGMFIASRRGEFSAVNPTLSQLIGHPPQTLRALLAGPSGPG